MKKLFIIIAMLALATPVWATYYGGNSDWTQAYTTDAHTQGLWHYDEVAGDVDVLDASANSNDGTLSTSVNPQLDPGLAWVTSMAGFGNAISTNSVTNGGTWGQVDYAQTEENQTLNSDSGEDLTIEFWMNPWQYGSRPWGSTIVIKGTGGDYHVEYSGGTMRFTQYYDGWQTTASSYVIPVSEWTHVAIVVDRSSAVDKDYIGFVINGSLVESFEVAGHGGGFGLSDMYQFNFNYAPSGALYDEYQYFGELDELRISNVARYLMPQMAIPEPSALMSMLACMSLLAMKRGKK